MDKHYKWDVIVRITHWAVAGLFFANYFVTEEGSEIHEWVGYCIIGSIVIRLVWGMITRSPARLSAFKPSVTQAVTHLSEVISTRVDASVGHNPAGAVMIWLMWCCLLATAVTGWMAHVELMGYKDGLKEIHEVFANLTFIAVAIHICAVIVMSRWTNRSYLSGMLK